MDDSGWSWSLGLVGDGEAAALVVVGALVLRVLPATRRWAPRGVRSTALRPRRPADRREPAGRS